jgi:hypothetical protein
MVSRIEKDAEIIALVSNLMTELREIEDRLKRHEELIEYYGNNQYYRNSIMITYGVPSAIIFCEELRSDLIRRKEFLRKIRSDYPEINFDSLIPVGF